MSGAILYLAIIAIWAGFLIPAWIRRPHAGHIEDDADLDASAYADTPAYDEVTADHPTDTESDVELGPEPDSHVEVSRRDQEYRDEVPNYAETGSRPGAAAGGDYGTRQPMPRPSQSRDQMLRARRRMLTILTGLTLMTGACTAAGLVRWWICVPPAGMLALYVLLLREIVKAEAEMAAKRDQAWAAHVAREPARQARQAAERGAAPAQPDPADQAGPGAQIIDISGRVGDQLYDQYADAAVRAVGD